jgi:hypothetical protein
MALDASNARVFLVVEVDVVEVLVVEEAGNPVVVGEAVVELEAAEVIVAGTETVVDSVAAGGAVVVVAPPPQPPTAAPIQSKTTADHSARTPHGCRAAGGLSIR